MHFKNKPRRWSIGHRPREDKVLKVIRLCDIEEWVGRKWGDECAGEELACIECL